MSLFFEPTKARTGSGTQAGFEEELRAIIKLLPTKRQTMLFSATQTKNVADLARLSINTKPVYVGVDDKQDAATVDNLEQGYVCVKCVHVCYRTVRSSDTGLMLIDSRGAGRSSYFSLQSHRRKRDVI